MGGSSVENASKFTKGSRVEVTSEEEGFTGAWFLAKIIDHKSNQVYIEYENLLDEDSSKPLRELVNPDLVRPLPPPELQKFQSFHLNDVVDAFHKDGWWTGVITKVFDHNSRFEVTFSNPPDLIVFGASELRLHRDWLRDKWIRPKKKKQEVSTSPDYQGSARNVSYNAYQIEIVSTGSLVAPKQNSEERTAGFIDLLDIRNERSTPSNLAPSTVMTSRQRKKAKLLSPDTDERTKKMIQANKSDLPHLPTDDLNTSPIIAPGEEIHFGSATSTNGRAKTNNSEKSMVDLPSDNFSQRKRASKRHKHVELENHNPNPSRRNVGRPPKSPINETQALAGDKRDGKLDHRTPEPFGRKSEMLPTAEVSGTETSGDKNDAAARCNGEDLVQKQCVTEVPFTRNLEKELIEGSRAEVLPQFPTEELLDVSGDQEQRVHDPAVDGIKEADQLEGRVESIGKRKRGRPPKKSPKSHEFGRQNGGKKLENSPEISRWNGGVAAADMALGDVVLPVLVGQEATKVDGSVSDKEKLRVDKKILSASVDLKSKSSSNIEVYPGKNDELQTRKVVQASVEKHEKDSSKRGRRRTISISPNQDPKDSIVGKMAEVNGKDSLVKEAETSIVRLPFNMSDDEPLSMWLEAPKTADALSASQGRNVEQCTTNRSQTDVMLSPQCNDQSLPFAKSSPLWKIIESMEVFHILPQKPHFQSLGSKNECSREGLAIALMVDFAGVVNKTSNLQIDVERNTIEEYLETLLQLENNGFDVKLPRDRLTQLLLIKESKEELQGKAKEGTYKIEEDKNDNVKMDEKVEEIENQIRKLQEGRALILSKKEEKKSAVASLELTVKGINDSIRNADLQFKALVAAPWQVS